MTTIGLRVTSPVGRRDGIFAVAGEPFTDSCRDDGGAVRGKSCSHRPIKGFDDRRIEPGCHGNTHAGKSSRRCVRIVYSPVRQLHERGVAGLGSARSCDHAVITGPFRKSSLSTSSGCSRSSDVVPEVGVEPTCPCGQRILSPPCLPFHHSGLRDPLPVERVHPDDAIPARPRARPKGTILAWRSSSSVSLSVCR